LVTSVSANVRNASYLATYTDNEVLIDNCHTDWDKCVVGDKTAALFSTAPILIRGNESWLGLGGGKIHCSLKECVFQVKFELNSFLLFVLLFRPKKGMILPKNLQNYCVRQLYMCLYIVQQEQLFV